MKMVKKIATMLLAANLLVSCFSMLVHAAGKIQFTDPTTKTGETVEVTVAVKGGTQIRDVNVVVNYDTNMLKFESGIGVTESNGKLTYSGISTGDTVRYTMRFMALKEGTTKLTVADYTVRTTSGTTLECTKGTSTIKIGAGADVAPSVPTEETDTEISVRVGEKDYVLSEDFQSTDIPKGYVEATLNYANVDYRAVQHETSGAYLGYLLDEAKNGQFFLYNSENATFSPFVQIEISDTTTITLLSNVDDIVLPEEFKATEIMVNGQDYPAWQETDKAGYCIIYGMNNQGENSLYQLDTTEGTYQRFEAPKTEDKDASFITKLATLLQEHLDYVILGVGMLVIFFLVLVIILGVKLHNRNVELDDLYEEYGIGYEEDDVKPSTKQKDACQDELEDDDDFDDDDDFKFEIDPSFYDDAFEQVKVEEQPRESMDNDERFEIDFIDLDD